MSPDIRQRPAHPESGAALVTVLFVFSICAVIAMAMLDRQKIAVERAQSLTVAAQADELALGAEELARQYLADNAALTPGIDFPRQAWATVRGGPSVEGGNALLRIEDLQGRFNLNTLVGGRDLPAKRFAALLKNLHIDPELAGGVIALLGTADRPRPLTDINDLRAIDGMSAGDFVRLRPFIAALPETDSLLNVNTASAVVLKAYIPDDKNYEHFVGELRRQGYLTQSQLNAIGMNTEGMVPGSHYFVVDTVVQLHSRVATLSSVLRRDQDDFGRVTLKVLSRDLSHPD